MDYFVRREDGQLVVEGCSLAALADEVGTPCYVYSYTALRRQYEALSAALAPIPHLVCYSLKANSNGAVLAALCALGAGADVVSGGELFRARRAGVPVERIVFSGVGKRREEIRFALQEGILLFNIESASELALIASVARDLGRRARVALRVNPDVDAETHPYIATGLKESKFGIPLRRAWALCQRALAMPELEVAGIDCHIGSQLTRLEPLVTAAEAMLRLARRLKRCGAPLRYLDVGGGLGIPYGQEALPTPEDYGRRLRQLLGRFADLDLTLICEPGRVIVGNAGVLLSRVLLCKDNGARRFVVVDGAMNDLIRPALYRSHHEIWPVQVREGPRARVDVVGPVCESGDFFARQRELPPLCAGDLVVVCSAGAYGFTMASNYNSRPRPAEVLVRGARHAVIRQRERYEDLVRGEQIPAWVHEP